MNTVPAQEIKRRGVAAIDDLIDKGAVHIIRNNRPQYVVLTQERYQDLLESEEEAWTERVRASLEDYKAGRVRRFNSAEELLQALDEEDDL
jgi:PHD/YefM family antitoxin component YafN of YafNO toxin-antitoxin module